jgi:threonine/homoserine/homoserine lactone efflux protein
MVPASGQLALFLAASLALTLTPGPAVLFIVARSLGQGRRAGLLSVAGIGLGNGVHAAATSLGLAALLASSPLAFTAVRWAGGAYLVVLGVRRLLRREAAGGAAVQPEAAAAVPGGGVLRQAFMVAVLNPKTALFFLAFLPQFADPRAGSLPAQLLLLGALFIAVAVATDTGYALAADGLGRFLRRHPGFGAGERWVSGAVFVGLGLLAALGGTPGAPGGVPHP